MFDIYTMREKQIENMAKITRGSKLSKNKLKKRQQQKTKKQTNKQANNQTLKAILRERLLLPCKDVDP